MTSSAAAAPPELQETSGCAIPRWRLHVLRAVAVFFAVSGCLSYPQMLFNASANDRGMIKAFLTGLWLMSFLAIRYPRKMLPIFLFEFAWKAVWLLVFGLPQWISGDGSPRLNQDLLEIGLTPILLALVIPWGYVWSSYFKRPAEPWR